MNNLQNLLHQPSVVLLGWSLIHFLWQGVVVALIVWGLLRLARGSTAQTRYAIAGGGMLVMLACPIITCAVMSGTGAVSQANAFQQMTPQPASASGGDADPASFTFSDLPSRVAALPHLIPAGRLLPFLVVVWGIGVGFLAIRLIAGWLRIVNVRRSAVPLTNRVIQARLAELARRMGIRTPVALLEAALAPGPAVIGVLRPAILFPLAALTGLWPIQIEAILAHELAHVRRHDYLVNLLQSFVEIVLFYHPAVWWVSGKIRQEREHCCDDLAVEACGDRTFYANCLADLDELRPAALALAMGASGGGLLPRIRRILGLPAGENCAASAAAGTLVVAAVGTAMLFLTAPGFGEGPRGVQLRPIADFNNIERPSQTFSATSVDAQTAIGHRVGLTNGSAKSDIEKAKPVVSGQSAGNPDTGIQSASVGIGDTGTVDEPLASYTRNQRSSPIPQNHDSRPRTAPLSVPFPNLSIGSVWGGGWLPRLKSEEPPSSVPMHPRTIVSPTQGLANRSAVSDFPPVPSQFEKTIQQRRSEPLPTPANPASPQPSQGAGQVPQSNGRPLRTTKYGGLLFVPEPTYVIPQDQNYVTPQSGNYNVPQFGNYNIPQFGNYVIPQPNYNSAHSQGSSVSAGAGRLSGSSNSSNYVHPTQQH